MSEYSNYFLTPSKDSSEVLKKLKINQILSVVVTDKVEELEGGKDWRGNWVDVSVGNYDWVIVGVEKSQGSEFIELFNKTCEYFLDEDHQSWKLTLWHEGKKSEFSFYQEDEPLEDEAILNIARFFDSEPKLIQENLQYGKSLVFLKSVKAPYSYLFDQNLLLWDKEMLRQNGYSVEYSEID